MRTSRALLGAGVSLERDLRMLELFAEAMAGKRVPLLAAAETDAGIAEEIHTDGQCIVLPAQVTRQASREENLAYLRLAILHQLAVFTEGTVEVLDELRAALESSESPAVLVFLFGRSEHERLDWILEHSFAGVACALERERRPAEPSAAVRTSDGPRARTAAQSLSLAREQVAQLAGQEATQRQAACAALDCVWLEPDEVLPDAAWSLSVAGALPHQGVFCFDRLFEAQQILEFAEEEATRSQEHAAAEVMASLVDPPTAVPDGSKLDNQKDEPITDELSELLTQLTENDALGLFSVQDGLLSSASGLLAAGLDDLTADGALPQAESEASGTAGADAEGRRLDSPALRRRLEELLDKAQALNARNVHRDKEGTLFFYDEWDSTRSRYRKNHCHLYLRRLEDHGTEFVEETLRELASLRKQVRRRFERMRPDHLRRLRGLIDGEEFDLDAVIAARVDKAAGAQVSERVYARRERQERDVAAAFLLDMSASTDSEVEEFLAEAQSREEPDPPEHSNQGAGLHYVGMFDEEPWDSWELLPRERGRRVIDIEKEAVVLMADALEELGDRYAIFGFSGYGRDNVEFYIAKPFERSFDRVCQGQLAAMAPRQSTRMGPAIRHATRELLRQDARTRALLIVSDGYPQDHDYGPDGNPRSGTREYGVLDTMMALREAEMRGIHTFCLTVDPAGHDYLRTMCPERRYMVIDDVRALSAELPKVYRALTG